MAACQNTQGKHIEAEPMFRQALSANKLVHGADHPSTVASVNNLAICQDDEGKRTEAEPMNRQALMDRTFKDDEDDEEEYGEAV